MERVQFIHMLKSAILEINELCTMLNTGHYGGDAGAGIHVRGGADSGKAEEARVFKQSDWWPGPKKLTFTCLKYNLRFTLT
mmetsp:Transcript_7466/g.13257  ORF Transcript_7466/g.13257 Transcript_7466/m.13257 type:complete len:81 (+) Transcript_7466:288-530(+)